MRQAFHIFKKDVRHLRWEIAVVLLLVAIGAFRQNPDSGIETSLLPLAWFLLTGRAIHSEALPGTKQFWLTRPYSRASLLAAKMLFLLAFIALPMAVSDIVILHRTGFTVSAYWPGLIWELLLRLVLFAGTAAAFAVITDDLRNQVGSLLLAGVLMLGLMGFGIGLFGPISWVDWGVLEWLHNSILVSLVAVGAAAITIWQYSQRRSVPVYIAIVGLLVLGRIIEAIPSGDGWWLSARLSGRWIEHGSLVVTLGPSMPPKPAMLPRDTVRVEIPLRIAGLPDGLTPIADEVNLDILSGSLTYSARKHLVTSERLKANWEAGDRGVFLALQIAHRNLEQMQYERVQLRTSVVLTLTRKHTTATVPEFQNDSESVAIPEVGICRLPVCTAPFRMPRVLVFFSPFVDQIPWVSYSPFPAGLATSPTIDRSIGGGFGAYTITTEEPVAHLRQDFTLDKIRLADFVAPEP